MNIYYCLDAIRGTSEAVGNIFELQKYKDKPEKYLAA